MLSYLILIISPKRLENTLHTDEKSDRHKDKRWPQKERKSLKKPILFVVNADTPDTKYMHYPLNVEGETQKSSLLPGHIR